MNNFIVIFCRALNHFQLSVQQQQPEVYCREVCEPKNLKLASFGPRDPYLFQSSLRKTLCAFFTGSLDISTIDFEAENMRNAA